MQRSTYRELSPQLLLSFCHIYDAQVRNSHGCDHDDDFFCAFYHDVSAE